MQIFTGVKQSAEEAEEFLAGVCTGAMDTLVLSVTQPIWQNSTLTKF